MTKRSALHDPLRSVRSVSLCAALLGVALWSGAAPAHEATEPHKHEGKPEKHEGKHGGKHEGKHEGQSKLPHKLHGKAVVLEASDPDYARADIAGAVKPAGEGGIKEGIVVRLTADVTVWRMWNGPAKKDARGNTNRLGQWWAYDAPRGTQEEYRKAYEICLGWNDLTWVAKCTLKKGAVVAIGPGNSVTAKVCGDPTGKEAYPVNERDWQVWLSKAWGRVGADKELDCPPESADYEANLAHIAQPKAPAAPPKAPAAR